MRRQEEGLLMGTPREDAALNKQLAGLAASCKSGDLTAISRFLSLGADFRAGGGIVRGLDARLSAHDLAPYSDVLRTRASAESVSMKWLSKGAALFDGVF